LVSPALAKVLKVFRSSGLQEYIGFLKKEKEVAKGIPI
jgi:hypothetical protein